MEDLQNESRLVIKREPLVTSRLFEAYLACPTKCYLQFIGEVGGKNDFAVWNESLRESYRREGILKLTTDHSSVLKVAALEMDSWKSVSWHLVLSPIVQAQNIEANLHLVQRIAQKKLDKSSELVPVRFVPENKLSRLDKMMAGFDAFALSKALGLKVGVAKIIHGDTGAASKIKAEPLSRTIKKTLGKISTLLSGSTPPELALNRHCPECEYQSRCRKVALEKDDLSLLPNLSQKEKSRLNSKGIFTVNQLSYTFRPRRRNKRLKSKPERYHHSLKALAIRERKIHVIGNPKLRFDGTPIFLDVEGLPDHSFYYLIGVNLDGETGPVQRSLWADSALDEQRNWSAFLDIVSAVTNPVLVHYGSFEAAFLRKMCSRYGGPPETSPAARAISCSVNLLSEIFAKVYFPCYSNGLKEVANFLGFQWRNLSSSGLQSIVWRHRWEQSRDPTIQEKLIRYNVDDCEALRLVAGTVVLLSDPSAAPVDASRPTHEIIHAESLGRNLVSKWRVFKSPIADFEKVNVAAHWDYQRDRVFVRSGLARKDRLTRSRTRRTAKKSEIVVVLKPPTACPRCGKKQRRRMRLVSTIVYDLVFGKASVKGRLINYTFQIYRCRSCGCRYNSHEWYRFGRKWGWNLLAYIVYHVVGLRVPQLTVQRIVNRLFGFDLHRSTLNNLKFKASDYYSVTKSKILNRIVHGKLIHADETRANIKGQLAYVWVLTNLREVVYILTESREGEIVHDLLKEFQGVLVTDFYAAYDGISCPQQKCLIHLMRDLNDDILNNPFDKEMKSIALSFAALLKPIIDTIDRRGLKKYFLRKHLVTVDRFYQVLDRSEFKSEVASRCKQRFERNRDKLFTFMLYDEVPWNNNNAEHAIKAFAGLRDVISGTSTKKGVDEYLTLLSVAQTCEYQGIDFLDFLRTGETDIETFARNRRRHPTQGKGIRTKSCNLNKVVDASVRSGRI